MNGGPASLSSRVTRRVDAFFDTQVSTRSLGLLRIVACAIILYRFDGLWAPRHFHRAPEQLLLVLAFLIATMFCCIGFHTRIAKVVMVVSFCVLFLYFGQHLGVSRLKKPFHPFHVVVLLALSPCGRSCSVDRLRAVRRARARGVAPPPERMPWVYLDLFALQICVMYFWAGFDKLDPGWLSGERLERTWMNLYASSDALGLYPWLHNFARMSAVIVTVTELGLIPLLAYRKTRHIAMWWGVAFHLGIYFTLNAPDFTVLVLTTYLCCLHPEQVKRWLDDLFERAATPPDAAA